MRTITIPELAARTEEILREVEAGQVVEVERDGKVVVRMMPAEAKPVRPWEAMHGKARLLASPEESVLNEEDFEVYR
ncbi:MAG TPA: type II toxin-antitoxin system prevent-host-death family antitoxin [Thermoanaerobaculia bacterium]|jgi:prevent-host-death family protein